MDDNKTFADFCSKLNDIINTSFNLGEKMSDSKVVRKFFRSLSESFKS